MTNHSTTTKEALEPCPKCNDCWTLQVQEQEPPLLAKTVTCGRCGFRAPFDTWQARVSAVIVPATNNALVQLLEAALLHPESAEGNIRQVIETLSASAPIVTPVVDRALYSELIHIAAELVRGDGFLSTCAEDMNPRLKRADVLKTAERQEERLKGWAYRLRRVADRLSPAAPAATVVPQQSDHLRAALENIASQRLHSEIEPIDGEVTGDFEGAYDIMINVARDALAAAASPAALRDEAEQCSTTCADFSMHLCSRAHRCVLDAGHSFDPYHGGGIHEFETHPTIVKPRKLAALGEKIEA